MGDVRTKWCPESSTLADFMTKPLLGALFTKFRDLVMGKLVMGVSDVDNKHNCSGLVQ